MRFAWELAAGDVVTVAGVERTIRNVSRPIAFYGFRPFITVAWFADDAEPVCAWWWQWQDVDPQPVEVTEVLGVDDYGWDDYVRTYTPHDDLGEDAAMFSTYEPYLIDTEIIETDAGIFRIEYRTDDDAMSPRDASNLGTMIIDEDFLDIRETRRRHGALGLDVDHRTEGHVMVALDAVRTEQVSIRAACRYLRIKLGAWAVLPIHASDYRTEVHVAWGDDESDDTGALSGFVWDTETGRRDMAPETPAQAHQWLREEVEALDNWTQGNYVMYCIERMPEAAADEVDDLDDVEESADAYPWDVVDSLCSIDSMDYAREEARATVNAYTAADFPSPALAAQV